jgi:hypothetical protein
MGFHILLTLWLNMGLLLIYLPKYFANPKSPILQTLSLTKIFASFKSR